MKTSEFVDNFCGPDLNALETVQECGIRSQADLFCHMRKMVRDFERDGVKLTADGIEGSDATVDLNDAAYAFINRLLDEIVDIYESARYS